MNPVVHQEGLLLAQAQQSLTFKQPWLWVPRQVALSYDLLALTGHLA